MLFKNQNLKKNSEISDKVLNQNLRKIKELVIFRSQKLKKNSDFC